MPNHWALFSSVRGPVWAMGYASHQPFSWCSHLAQWSNRTMRYLSHSRRLRHHDRRQFSRKASRPALLEWLEPRLALANVAVLSGHNDALLSGANTQETVLTP